MFLGLLSPDEKSAFVALAEKMIDADGIVVPSESAALASLRQEVGMGGSEASEETDIATLAQTFASRRSRVVALLELMGLGYSDTRFSIDERSLVSLLAHEMEVDAAELAKLEAWVKQHVAHVETALKLMQG